MKEDIEQKGKCSKLITYVCSKFASTLRSISIGKYSHVLFFKNKSEYSSCMGGIISVTLTMIILCYAFILLSEVLNKE